MFAHVAGVPVEEALLAAPALLAALTVITGYLRATAARLRRARTAMDDAACAGYREAARRTTSEPERRHLRTRAARPAD